MLASLGLRFTVAAIIVILAGTVLARSGDVIAARTKLGGVWVGSVFLALATSLPELVTDIAAVRMGALDLAIGDLFGSSMANMLILAIVGLAPAGAELFVRATLDHVIYAALAIVLTAAAAASILAPTSVAWLGIGVGSWILLLVYGVASRAAFRSSRVTQEAGQTIEMSGPAESIAAVPSPHDDAAPSLPRALLHFAGAALVILLVAPQFATAAEGLAVATGVGSTFMGSWDCPRRCRNW
jgi:cation:H+ antiporter